MNTRIIQITFEGIKFNPGHLLPWNQTNLPEGAFSIRKNKEIFWEIAITQMDKQALQFSVLDYLSSNKDRFDNQVVKRNVSNVAFDLLDWNEFQKYLSSYVLNQLKSYVIIEEPQNGNLQVEPIPVNKEIQMLLSDEIYEEKLVERIPLEDIVFYNGYIVFQFDYYLDQINIQVDNPFVYQSLNLIKSYFPKALKTTHITANIQINILKMQVISATAQSNEIDQINMKTIEIVKNLRIEGLDKLEQNEVKRIFSLEDILHSNDPNLMQIEDPDPLQIKDILDYWINRKPVRNRLQLEFLSGQVQSPNQKIRITLYPKFGFLFSYESKLMWHFCWELLDSNATYLWSYDHDEYSFTKCIIELEGILTSIKTYGRNFYRKSYKIGSSNYLFVAINHEPEDQFRKDGFTLWKDRLLSKLV